MPFLSLVSWFFGLVGFVRGKRGGGGRIRDGM